jgi:hypothetical protein
MTMKCEDFKGKIVLSVHYEDASRLFTIRFTDGTYIEADDGYSYGVVVTTSNGALEPTVSGDPTT